MIVTFYGTAAELIKMYGIVTGLPRGEQLLICTGQQHAGLQKVQAQLGITPDLYLGRGHRGEDVATMGQVLALMLGVHARFVRWAPRLARRIRQHDRTMGTRSIALVHGDTLTTVVGAYLGRTLGLPVGHVEAGLRSGSWRSPFPEELDRRAASKISRVHFPPNEEAASNLRLEKVKGDIVPTTFNTAKDAIERAGDFVGPAVAALSLPTDYLLVLLHRTELIENRDDFTAVLQAIADYADAGHEVVFATHTTTASRLRAFNLESLVDRPNITRIPKQPYFDFMAIVDGAQAIITDGGGLQEDGYFLGIPTLVHRRRTERSEGLGSSAVLSGMDLTVVRSWLQDHPARSALSSLRDGVSPSALVIDYLRQHRYVASGTASHGD
jgi:UDP-N-acetylglucosamine 2-epimerase (non-hydrolysing)